MCLFAVAVTLILSKISSRIIRNSALALTCLASVLFIIDAVRVFLADNSVKVVVLRVASELQIAFWLDRLSAFFIILISIVVLAVCIYSMRYIELSVAGLRRRLFVPLMISFILAMILFVVSANAFSQLVFWELMSLLSFFLVMLHYKNSETPKAGLFYFVMTQMSTAWLMLAFIIIYIQTGSFEMQRLTDISPFLNAVIFLALFVGFGIKAGMVPLHKWLPYAHSSSPSNVSALMSGVMIKIAVYGLIRYIYYVLQPQLWWGILILLFGTISALLGVVYALKEHDIKRLLAYHSIENIGIILIGLGLAIIFDSYGLDNLATLSLAAAILHTLNHAIFKSLLFLTAGSVVESVHTRNIEKMGGLIRKMPFTAVLFLLGAIAISALPPLNGFISELMLFQSFFQSFELNNASLIIFLFICLSLFALTSALAAACFVKAFAMIFLAMPRSDAAVKAREAHPVMIIGPALLALLCLIIGIFALQIFRYLGYQAPIPDMAMVGLILAVLSGLTWLLVRLFSLRRSRRTETWACGLPAPDSRSEYTASGFSEPIVTFFRPIYQTRKELKREFWDKWSSVFKSGSFEIHTMRFFEEKLYLPVVNALRKVSFYFNKAQNVDLDTFILYSFITIVILMVVIGWIL